MALDYGTALQQNPSGGGVWDTLSKTLQDRPELFAIALDMLGSGIRGREQGNPFAGIGSALGQSGLAAKAEKSRRKESSELMRMIIGALTAPDKPGLTAIEMGSDGQVKTKFNPGRALSGELGGMAPLNPSAEPQKLEDIYKQYSTRSL
jgi:hypothetical protein